jgi:hypothetical protein
VFSYLSSYTSFSRREGLDCLRKSLSIREFVLGESNPAALRTRYNLGLALCQLQSVDEQEFQQGLIVLQDCCEEMSKGENQVHSIVALQGLWLI